MAKHPVNLHKVQSSVHRNKPRCGTAYLQEEVTVGRVMGPLQVGSISRVQVSPFGVIPKSHTPGKWRLIVDLSSPNEAASMIVSLRIYSHCPTSV